MYVSELSREQLVELKSTMLEAILGYEPSYGELAIADELVSDEQVEEEENAKTIIDSLKMIGDNGYGLYTLDKDLSTRVYTQAAPLANKNA